MDNGHWTCVWAYGVRDEWILNFWTNEKYQFVLTNVDMENDLYGRCLSFQWIATTFGSIGCLVLLPFFLHSAFLLCCRFRIPQKFLHAKLNVTYFPIQTHCSRERFSFVHNSWSLYSCVCVCVSFLPFFFFFLFEFMFTLVPRAAVFFVRALVVICVHSP